MAKGQSFLIEMFLISTAVIMLVMFFFLTLNAINIYKTKTLRANLIAEDAASTLLLSRGYPADWDQNVSNTQALGLALRRNTLDMAKLRMFNQTAYSELLGLGAYNISLNITSGTSTIFQTGFINSSTSVIQVERVCIYNNAPCKLRLQVSGGPQ